MNAGVVAPAFGFLIVVGAYVEVACASVHSASPLVLQYANTCSFHLVSYGARHMLLITIVFFMPITFSVLRNMSGHTVLVFNDSDFQ